MRFVLCFLLITSLFASCINNDFPALEESGENIFGGDGPDLFELVEVEQFVETNDLRRLRVTFRSVYDQIPQIQRESIENIVLITPTRGIFLALDRTQFQESGHELGSTPCFKLAFSSQDSEIENSRATEFCILVE